MQDLGSSELRKDIYITVHIIRIGRCNHLWVDNLHLLHLLTLLLYDSKQKKTAWG